MSWKILEDRAFRFHLKSEYVAELREFYERNCDWNFLQTAAGLISGDFPELEIRSRYGSEKDRNQFRLLCAVACYPVMEEFYRTKQYPAEMLEDISHDLAVWVDTLYPDLGYAGLISRFLPWFRCTLDGQVKQMGRLQFNTIHLFYPKYSFYRQPDGTLLQKDWLDPDNPPHPDLSCQDKVINIHIPAGRPLVRRDCILSLQKAAEFSRRFQPDYDYRAFVCYSWLLDPVFQKILPASSNIPAFQKLGHNYVMPGLDETNTVLWRIWGDAGRMDHLDHLERRHSLQRCVADYLKSGGTFTEGGLIIFRDELPGLLAEL